ncbi:hypothetical protein HDV57DRAFT_526263 [Trichoderma longibrachiatum]
MSGSSVFSKPHHPTVLPKDLVSKDTLLYLGLNEETAEFIWMDRIKPLVRKYAAEANDRLGKTFLANVIEHVYDFGQVSNTCDDDDRLWHRCMNLCGLDRKTKLAIMAPIFKKTRLTQSCLHWVCDTITLRFKALQELRAAEERAILEEQIRGASQVSVSGPSQPEETAMNKAVLHDSVDSSDETVTLYKGIDRASLGHLFKNKLHSSRISSLATRGPTDVSPTSSAYYFYVDRDIAEQQACYIKQRSNLTPVVLVQVTIPKAMLETGYEGPRREEVYWPSEDWKTLVFHCRRKRAVPADLAKYMDAQLVVTTVAARASRCFMGHMKRPDQVTEDMVLKNKHGEDAIQYCFRRPHADWFLAEHAELKMLPFTDDEFRAWCVEAKEWELKDIPKFSLPCCLDSEKSHGKLTWLML